MSIFGDSDASGGMSAGTDGGFSTSGTAPQGDASSSSSDGNGGMSAGTDGGYSTSGTSPNSSSASEPAPAEPQDWDEWSSNATNYVIDEVKGAAIDLGEAALGIPEYAGKVLGLQTDNPQFMKDVDPATGLPRTDAGAPNTSPATPPADAGHTFDLSAPAVSAVDVGEISPTFVDGGASSGPVPMDDSELDEPSAPAPTLESEPADVNYALGETSAPSTFDGSYPTLGETSAPADVEYPLGETSAPSTFDASYPTLGETSAPPDVDYPEGETSHDSLPESSEELLYHDSPEEQNPAADVVDPADVGEVIDVEESYENVSVISCDQTAIEDPAAAVVEEVFDIF